MLKILSHTKGKLVKILLAPREGDHHKALIHRLRAEHAGGVIMEFSSKGRRNLQK